jgi:hypothetical protein
MKVTILMPFVRCTSNFFMFRATTCIYVDRLNHTYLFKILGFGLGFSK